jgi:hypothetical protein
MPPAAPDRKCGAISLTQRCWQASTTPKLSNRVLTWGTTQSDTVPGSSPPHIFITGWFTAILLLTVVRLCDSPPASVTPPFASQFAPVNRARRAQYGVAIRESCAARFWAWCRRVSLGLALRVDWAHRRRLLHSACSNHPKDEQGSRAPSQAWRAKNGAVPAAGQRCGPWRCSTALVERGLADGDAVVLVLVAHAGRAVLQACATSGCWPPGARVAFAVVGGWADTPAHSRAAIGASCGDRAAIGRGQVTTRAAPRSVCPGLLHPAYSGHEGPGIQDVQEASEGLLHAGRSARPVPALAARADHARSAAKKGGQGHVGPTPRRSGGRQVEARLACISCLGTPCLALPASRTAGAGEDAGAAAGGPTSARAKMGF